MLNSVKSRLHDRSQISKVRIISGKYKSRQIKFNGADNASLRPTSDRLRETLFNWLMPYIFDATSLDAFAGSGALGFEALSRLAKSCDFFELDHQAIQHLNSNKAKLNINNACIQQKDVLSHLKTCDNYQVIFLDPPFNSDLLHEALSSIIDNNNINDESVIYAECGSNIPASFLECFTTLKKTKQGAIYACLLQKQPFIL